MKNKKNTIIIIVAIFFSIIFSLIFKWIQTGNPFRAETIMYGAIVFLNALLLGSIASVTLKRFSEKSTTQTNKQIIPAFLIFVIIALIISLSVVSAGVYSFYLIKGLDTSNFINHLFKVELNSAIKQFSIWILLGSAFFFYTIWRKAIEREQILQKENLKYKYQNLKSQVNPHFLFNSLNTLSELVYLDAEKSDKYIQKLSTIYRYILENEETDLIPLKQEIEFVKQFFELQSERDNGKISLEIDVNDDENYKVTPVSLQLLVENALKHNARSQKHPLKIKISIEDNFVVVSNSVLRKSTIESSTKTGLSNLKERVRVTMDEELIVIKENNQFIVKMPILE